jgi:type VI secretion system protein ImpL
MNFLLNFVAMASGYAAPVMQYVRRRWVRTLIWALAACLVVFFYGDSIRLRSWSPLDTTESRIVVCVLIMAGWAGYLIFAAVRDRRANAAMIGAITSDAGPARPDMSNEELEQIRTRLQEALNELRRVTRGRRGYVYQLPWYIIIGPPGSGKTTALLNSGLKFPLAETMGKDPLRGVGGTRNCEWWFTEEAILLDTAGRYTTQDSDPEADRRGWTGFLNLLKTYRPLQPINGVIVALSLEEIVHRNPAERLSNARAIRSRLAELSRTFGSRFPIYVLVTKVDLLAGFVQFFDAYNRSDREQVWGMTFPLDDGKPETQAAATRFDIEFDGLLTRMNAIVLERLQQEADIARRGLIFGFPIQVATLKEPLKEVLDEVFAASKYEDRMLLRGVYLASSTQSGVPIDRMMQAMAATFGMEMPRQPAFAGQERSYFLTRLLDQVVFAEASVVTADPRTRQRMLMTRRIAGAVAAVVVVGLLGAWSMAYVHNQALVAMADRQVADYRNQVNDIPIKDVSDADFDRVLPPLNALRDDPAALRQQAGSAWLQFGLSQSDKLQSQYASLYARALDTYFLPRVLVVLQKDLRNGRTDDNAFKVGALKVYLGVGGAGPLDKPFARKWMTERWQVLYPNATDAGKRADLDRHFAALLDIPLDPIPLDADLVSQVRGQIRKVPMAGRAYERLRSGSEAAQLPAWTVENVVGAPGERAFTRVSGKPLTAGISGFYTRDGYFKVFLPGLQDAVKAAEQDNWIYGDTDQKPADANAIAAQSVELYRGDFNATWSTLLNDLRIRPLTDLHSSVIVLTALSGPDSVLMKLLNAVVRDTDLSPPPADAKDKQSEQIRAMMTKAAPEAAPADPYQPLRNAMKPSGSNPPQIAELMQTLSDLYAQLSRTASSPQGVLGVQQTEGGLNDANQKLLSESRQEPEPVQTWLSGLTSDVSNVTSGTAKTAIEQAWNGTNAQLCAAATSGRYPFSRGAESEISVDDFSRLFGPNGMLDTFFNQNLRQNVNMASHPWKWQATGTSPVSAAFLLAFEHADAIRQAFFGAGGNASFHYQISPDSLDSAATNETLDIGGQTLTYAHGPVRPTGFVWPAPGNDGVRLDVEPAAPGSVATFSGIWGPFRLFDSGNIYARTRDGFTVSFPIGSHSVSYVVQSESALNPFTLRDLRAFRCPDKF